MSKFNIKKRVVSRPVKNLAGGKAFSMDAKTELVHAVLTTFLEDKFYESGPDRLNRIVALVGKVNPEFVAKLAIVARKEFNLRSVTHLLLGELSHVHNGDGLVKSAIVESAIRPDDLTEIASYLEGNLPKQVKRGIRNALLKFNPYQLAKYKGEGKGISLVDLFNLTHPNPKFASKEQKKAWKQLIEGKLASFDTWETELSNAKDDKGRKKALESLIAEDKMGYMALLRNLNNLIKYDVNKKTIDRVIEKLTDEDEVHNSKQLPFRFYTAYQNVTGNREFKDAISEAMDIALDNTPELKGKTLIAVDVSGSMSGDPIQKASIFAATLMKANKRADVVLYDTRIREVELSSRIPVIDLADKVMKLATGGGTETSLVFKWAKKEGKEYDRIIILSDNESWNEYSVQDVYKDVKEDIGDPFVYAIDIQGYGTKDIKGGRVFHLTGWSDRLLDFIGRMEEGDTLIKYIDNYELSY